MKTKTKDDRSLYQKAWDRMADMGFGPREMDFIFADWPNQTEHYKWLLRASRDKTQDWIDAGR